jgi:hypothetical protein
MENIEEKLCELEKQYWTGDSEFYENNLTEDSLMVFAEPVGVLTKEQAVETIAGSQRWVKVDFNESRIVLLTDSVAVLTYKSAAQRQGDNTTYRANASSVYVWKGGAWKLALHQQTPA